jgi:hypothetical protein
MPEPQTEWQKRVREFEIALQEGWREFRLIPLIFQSLGQVYEGGSGARRVGGASRLPSPYFWDPRSPSVTNIAREWGAEIARNETREFLSLLGEECSVAVVQRPLGNEIYRAVASMSSRGLSPSAVFVPAGSPLLREMPLEPPGDITPLVQSKASQWHRGSLSGVPVFLLPQAQTADVWVVDFRELGTWLHPGVFDQLLVNSELSRSELVDYENTRVPATIIDARSYFDVQIQERDAAVGLRLSNADAT